jgi:hypothetical protein
MAMRLALPLLLAAGCATAPEPDEIEVTLAEPIPLHVRASDRHVQIVLGALYPSLDVRPCSTVSADLTARLNGVPVPLVTRGGRIGESPGDVSANGCVLPRLELDMPPPDGSSTLELSDPSTTLTCRLPDLKAAREAALVPPAPDTWTWRPGQQVTVQWSPSGDLPLWSSFSVELLHLNATGSSDGPMATLDATLEGDLVHFAIPSVSPGSYTFLVAPSLSVLCGHGADITSMLAHFAVARTVAITP